MLVYDHNLTLADRTFPNVRVSKIETSDVGTYTENHTVDLTISRAQNMVDIFLGLPLCTRFTVRLGGVERIEDNSYISDWNTQYAFSPFLNGTSIVSNKKFAHISKEHLTTYMTRNTIGHNSYLVRPTKSSYWFIYQQIFLSRTELFTFADKTTIWTRHQDYSEFNVCCAEELYLLEGMRGYYSAGDVVNLSPSVIDFICRKRVLDLL